MSEEKYKEFLINPCCHNLFHDYLPEIGYKCSLCSKVEYPEKVNCEIKNYYCTDCLNNNILSKIECDCKSCLDFKNYLFCSICRKYIKNDGTSQAKPCGNFYCDNCSIYENVCQLSSICSCFSCDTLSKTLKRCTICSSNFKDEFSDAYCEKGFSYCKDCLDNSNNRSYIKKCKCIACKKALDGLAVNPYEPLCAKCSFYCDLALQTCNHNLCNECLAYSNSAKIDSIVSNILKQKIEGLEPIVKFKCAIEDCKTRLSVPMSLLKEILNHKLTPEAINIIDTFMMYLDGIRCRFYICECNKVVGILAGGKKINCSCSS